MGSASATAAINSYSCHRRGIPSPPDNRRGTLTPILYRAFLITNPHLSLCFLSRFFSRFGPSSLLAFLKTWRRGSFITFCAGWLALKRLRLTLKGIDPWVSLYSPLHSMLWPLKRRFRWLLPQLDLFFFFHVYCRPEYAEMFGIWLGLGVWRGDKVYSSCRDGKEKSVC